MTLSRLSIVYFWLALALSAISAMGSPFLSTEVVSGLFLCVFLLLLGVVGNWKEGE